MKVTKYIISVYMKSNPKTPIISFETYDENDINLFFDQMNDTSFRFLHFGPIGINKVEFSHCIIKEKKSR